MSGARSSDARSPDGRPTGAPLASALPHAGGAVRVRRAGLADLEQAAVLFDAYRQFYSAPPDVDGARRFLGERLARDESVVLLAFHAATGAAERAIGLAQLYRSFSSVSLGDLVILNDLFVAPEARGRGVGAALLDASVAHGRSVGAVRMELATQHGNEAALALYVARGFAIDREFKHLALAL